MLYLLDAGLAIHRGRAGGRAVAQPKRVRCTFYEQQRADYCPLRMLKQAHRTPKEGGRPIRQDGVPSGSTASCVFTIRDVSTPTPSVSSQPAALSTLSFFSSGGGHWRFFRKSTAALRAPARCGAAVVTDMRAVALAGWRLRRQTARLHVRRESRSSP